jgi:hypothetical protein
MIRDQETHLESVSSLEKLEDSVPGLRTALEELIAAFPELRTDAIRAALGLPRPTLLTRDYARDSCQEEEER